MRIANVHLDKPSSVREHPTVEVVDMAALV